MPTYEYRCPACSHRFELRQGFQDPPVAQCPKCQSSAGRVISRNHVEGWVDEVPTFMILPPLPDQAPSGVAAPAGRRTAKSATSRRKAVS